MTLYVRVTSTEDDPGAIQGHVRSVTRALASSLRPDFPFRDAMSSRQGWDVEGVAGQKGVGACASYLDGETTYALTLRAVWLDEEAGQQEWSVEAEAVGPITSEASRRRGQLVVIAGLHGAVVGGVGVWMVLSPFIETTGTILGVMGAPFLGFAAAATAARLLPEPPAPPDPDAARAAWLDEVLNAIDSHPDITLVERVDHGSPSS